MLKVLGVSLEEVILEETRLFYVAMTRAKGQLYIMTEQQAMSDFVRNSPQDHELSNLLTVQVPKPTPQLPLQVKTTINIVKPPSSAPKLWVGVRIDNEIDTYVYDAELQTGESGIVSLYNVAEEGMARYSSSSISHLVKTVTTPEVKEAAIKNYVSWKNSNDVRLYFDCISIAEDTEEFIDYEKAIDDLSNCPCPICNGHPSCDPLFYSYG